MINYIKGDITELTPASVTIEINGIGYLAHISLNTYSVLENKPSAKIYVYESIREDAYQLFGFIDQHEREIFMHLISVSGIGASTARMILSSMTAQELASVISSGNTDILKTVKGIGLKTAQRIIVDLKDKIKAAPGTEVGAAPNSEVANEAIAALVMLGFAQTPSQKAVSKILKDNPNSSIEQIIKTALKLL